MPIRAPISRTTGCNANRCFRSIQIKTLHFCSFVILDAEPDGGFGPSLVFEATFDGGRAEFLQTCCGSLRTGCTSCIVTVPGILRRG